MLSNINTKAVEEKVPVEVYEEIFDKPGLKGNSEVYDVPEAISEGLVAYATTDVSGMDMVNSHYAVTDILQLESQCTAYAVSDCHEGKMASETQESVGAEVGVENGSISSLSETREAAAGETAPQTDEAMAKSSPLLPTAKQRDSLMSEIKAAIEVAHQEGESNTAVAKPGPLLPPAKQLQMSQSNAKTSEGQKPASQSNTQKQPLRPKPPISSAKPSLRPSNRKDSRDKIVPAATSDAAADVHRAKNVRVTFQDEDRRRSQSYTGVGWEDGKSTAVTPDGATNMRSSLRGKPKPKPKARSVHLKNIRERGSSDSGVQQYAKLDSSTQYASLEPHTGNEMHPIDESSSNITQKSYSHLKR